MKESDEEKTSFITLSRVFCFVHIHEGIKNNGSNFNRAIDEIFRTKKGRNLLAYIDDVIVRCKKKQDNMSDLPETFTNLRRHGLKLNPEKCTFGETKGKLLDCLESQA